MVKPLVSAVIPVFNGEAFLAEAIASALAQTYRPLEIIVIDDGSTDGSLEVARGFAPQVRCHSQRHQGLAAARNLGLSLAAGEIFAHLDADDRWPPDSLALRAAVLAAEDDVDIVYGHVRQFFSSDVPDGERNKIRCPPQPMPGVIPGAMMARRGSFLRVGWYETSWKIGADMDWVLRAKEAGLASVIIPEVVLERRIHGANMGIVQREHFNERLRILKKSLDRRRAAAEKS